MTKDRHASDPVFVVELETAGGDEVLRVPATEAGASLAAVLRAHHHPLHTRCGEEGRCLGCQVILQEGRLRSLRSGEVVEADPVRARKACEHQLVDPVTRLQIPAASSAAAPPHVVTEFRLPVLRAHAPVAPPLRKVEAGALGLAIDVGTTTVALALVDLATGEIVSRASGFNEQIHHGEDVVTRIGLCARGPDKLSLLQDAVARKTLVRLIQQAARHAQVAVARIGRVRIAANTTMLHLLAGEDPSPLGVVPFRPRFLAARPLPPALLGLSEQTDVLMLPGASAYVGADVVAGLVATDFAAEPGPTLFVDAGTNGEIVLQHRGTLYGCATAMGPAFEGVGLRNGMRAVSGAVTHVSLRSDPFRVELEQLGRGRPKGLCGTAYIDLLAEAGRVGLIGPNGRFGRTAPGMAGDHWRAGSEKALALVRAAGHPEIMITESDIARLLQAKAALGAGILTLLDVAGCGPADLRRTLLAGGFGLHIRPAAAVACGLLPGLDPSTVEPVGNTSLAGAYLALLDSAAEKTMSDVAARVKIVELNEQPSFENRYIDQLFLP